MYYDVLACIPEDYCCDNGLEVLHLLEKRILFPTVLASY